MHHNHHERGVAEGVSQFHYLTRAIFPEPSDRLLIDLDVIIYSLLNAMGAEKAIPWLCILWTKGERKHEEKGIEIWLPDVSTITYSKILLIRIVLFRTKCWKRLLEGSGVKDLHTPGEGNAQSTPVFLLGKSHGQRSLVGCCLKGCKKVGLS